MPKVDTKKLIRNLIKNIGDDPDRKGLKETPARVENMLEELFEGYNNRPKDVFKFFESNGYDENEVIRVENIPFCSFCEHHMLPFFGTISISYKPDGRILGLSKFARLVDIFAKRLQLQERLTQQIADSIMKYLKPKECIVIVEAEHMCMTVRGVRKLGSKTVTECCRGTVDW